VSAGPRQVYRAMRHAARDNIEARSPRIPWRLRRERALAKNAAHVASPLYCGRR
jgi:hypothetical protein